MRSSTYTFDIETIPQREKLSLIQKEELQKKVDSHLSRKPDEDEEKVRNMLMATSPYFGNIICIGVKHDDHSYYIKDEDESELISKFWKSILDFNGIFISYNGLRFDCPFIIKRSMKFNIFPTNRNFLDLKPFKNFPHFDVQNVISNHNKFNSITLRLACEHTGIPSPKEGDVKAENVFQAYLDGRIDEIAEYCMLDTKRTYQLYSYIKPYIY